MTVIGHKHKEAEESEAGEVLIHCLYPREREGEREIEGEREREKLANYSAFIW